MSQFKDKSLDDLHKQVNGTRERLLLADEHIKALGDGAEKIGLSITGATLEMNVIMKQLFLCSYNDMQEYDILHEQLIQHLNSISLIANTRFGRLKKPDAQEGVQLNG
jgi:hypothetical protein